MTPGDTYRFEIMIVVQRAWRRGLLFALLLGIVRLLWRANFGRSRCGPAADAASLDAAAPPSVPVAKVRRADRGAGGAELAWRR